MTARVRYDNGLSIRIGKEIKKGLEDVGWTQQELANKLGVHHSAISNYVHGKSVPLPEVASLLSETLFNPKISELVIKSRMRKCVICEKEFVDNGNGGKPARTCGPSCRKVRRERERMGYTPRSGVVTNHRWEVVAEQVKKYCFECNPDGVCRDAGCHLRGISPLPLYDGRRLRLVLDRSA